MLNNSFYRSQKSAFLGKLTPGISTEITVIYRVNGGLVGKVCGITKRFFLFPGRAVNISLEELNELARFAEELSGKFTGYVIDEVNLPVPEITRDEKITLPAPEAEFTREPEITRPETIAVEITAVPNLPGTYNARKFTGLKIASNGVKTTGTSSKGVACKCGGRKTDKMGNWRVLSYKGGGASEWSLVNCGSCGNTWRTKLPYVDLLISKHKTA